MVDGLTIDRILHWALFGIVAFVMLLLDVLPLGSGSPGWPAPDWVLVLAAVWVLRRPEYLPLPLFAALALLADFMVMRPPGLHAVLSIAVIEFLRSRANAAREWPFALEWAMVAVPLLGLLVANRFVQFLFVLPQAGFGLEMQQYLSSVLVYPVLVGLSVGMLGLARPKPGDRGAQA